MTRSAPRCRGHWPSPPGSAVRPFASDSVDVRRHRWRRKASAALGKPKTNSRSGSSSAPLDALGNLSALDRETLTATFWEEAATTSGATLRKRRERALDRLRESFRKLYGF